MKNCKAHILTNTPNQNEVEITKCYNDMKDKIKTTKTKPEEMFGKGVSKLINKSQRPPEDIVKNTTQINQLYFILEQI